MSEHGYRHDQNCPSCGGRGHIWSSPEALGWSRIPGQPRGWFAKGGGVRTFKASEAEQVMVLCSCVKRRQDAEP